MPALGDLRTDDDGWLVLDPAPLQPFTLWTWREEYQDPEARIAALSRADPGTVERARISLGPIAVPAHDQAEITLRLPPR